MVGKCTLKVLSIIGVVIGLAMLSFAQNHSGTNGGTSGVLPVLDVRDVSGVDCTGATDSSTALNALTGNPPTSNNAITGRTLSFGNCLNIQLANTWLIKNQASFIIDGVTRSGSASRGVQITWTGAASGVMVDMEYVDGFQVQGFYVNGSTNGGVGIVVDKNGSGGTWNTTDGRFISNTFQGLASNWVGISISPVSVQNVEDMRVEDSSFYCAAPVSTSSAVGIVIGNSANAKNEIFRHDEFTLCYYGIWQKGGSMQVLESENESNGGTCASGTGADIRIDQNSDVDLIEGNLEENGTQGINQNNDSSGGGINFPVVVRGNHNSPDGCENTGVYWYNTGSGSQAPWIFEGNGWDGDSNLVKLIGTAGSNASQIYTSGNVYPNSSFNPWWTSSITSLGNSNDVGILTDRLLVYGAKTGQLPATGDYPSPFLVFRGYFSASTANPDDFAMQNIPASNNGTSGGTFLIKHQQGATGTEMFGWDGSYPGINIAAVSTPTLISVTPRGTAGSTSYTYAIVAYEPVGNTAGSATVNTAKGASTLTTANYNQLLWTSVAGATKYCIWRTVSSGSPSSTGNIGCISALQINYRWFPNLWGTAYHSNNAGLLNQYIFNDTGIAGDSTSLPSSNTTGTLSLPGQITSTLATGIAPFSIASTTPVSNLTLKNHPQVYEEGVLKTIEKIYTNTQALTGGAATHTFAKSFAFTSSSAFGCTCTDQTAANACRAVPASATAVTLEGTGSDVLWLQCAGH